MAYKFGDVPAAESSSFIQPGYYRMKPIDVKFGKLANEKESKYLGVKFSTADGEEYEEKFFLSEGALPRLQYLHQAYFNKLLAKEFKSDKELETYFKKALTGGSKPLTHLMLLGGNVDGDKVYAQFPFSGFIVPKEEEGNVEEGAFEEGDENWKKFVKKSGKKSSTVVDKKNGKVNDDEGDSSNDSTDSDDDMPW